MSQKTSPIGLPEKPSSEFNTGSTPEFSPQSTAARGSSTHKFYIDAKGRSEGPYSAEQLKTMLVNGRLRALDLVFRDGELEWKPIASFPELRSAERPRIEAQPDLSAEVMPAVAWVVLRPAGGTYAQEGPFSTATVIDGLWSGQFVYSQFAWRPGLDQWTRLGNLSEFDRRSRLRAESPPVPPPLPKLGELETMEAEQALSEQPSTHASIGTGETLRVDRLAEEIPLTGKESTKHSAGEAWSPFEDDADEVEVVVGRDLAQVPWEHERASEVSAPTTLPSELPGGAPSGQSPVSALADSHDSSTHSASDASHSREAHFRPKIVTGLHKPASGAEEAPLRDPWEIWGKKAAGGLLMGLMILFGQHLITRPSATELSSQTSDLVRRNPAESSAQAPALAPGENAGQVSSQAQGDSARSTDSAGYSVRQPVAETTLSKDNVVQGSAPPSGPQNPVVQAQPQSQAAMDPGPALSKLRVRGQKMNRSEAAILVEGVKGLGAMELKFGLEAKVGQILQRYHLRKEKMLAIPPEQLNADLVRIELKNFQLPKGEYRVRVVVGNQVAEQTVFYGERNAEFLSEMETHLRAISFEAQAQKKSLFYLSRDMDVLARELGEKYGQLRGRTELWSKFMANWQIRMKRAETQLLALSRLPEEQQVFPEPTRRLALIQESMKGLGSQYQQSIKQQRDVASDQLSSLISELARTKEGIGALSWRTGAESELGL